jgi:hypothetical protein
MSETLGLILRIEGKERRGEERRGENGNKTNELNKQTNKQTSHQTNYTPSKIELNPL